MTSGSSQSSSPFSAPLQRAVGIGILLAIGYGLYQVIALCWICDDAFISFRYARNLVNGLGLVYNAGERVEGYTNFLWTVITAAGMWLRLAPESLSVWLGAIAFFLSVGLFGYLSFRLFRNGGEGPALFLPLTSLALLLHHECHVFATSGLETSFVTALVSAGFVMLVLADRNRSYLLAGCTLTAAVLTRPDAMIFYVMAAGFILFAVRPKFRPLLWYLAPIVLIYVPYWIIRYNYYGYPFPNTYYAKSADLPYYSQGLTYLWLYVKSYYILLLTPLVAVWLVISRRKLILHSFVAGPVDRAVLLTLLLVGPYLFYVVRSGGDFMFGRFLIPVTPILFFLLELGLRRVCKPPFVLVVAGVAMLTCVAFRWDIYSDVKQIGYVADEPSYYTQEWRERGEAVGTKMKQYFAGTHAAASFRGMYAIYAYYSEVPVAIEQATGLTDVYLAHQPITKRGRPGHEKPAPWDYLRQRGVNFIFQGGTNPHNAADSLALIQFGDFATYIVTYDVALMEHLKQYPEIIFRDVRSYLDSLRAQSPDCVPPQAIKQYPFLELLYFDHNADSSRQQWFLDATCR